MPDRLRSVRIRITVAATLVTGIAVLAAGSWLVHTVEISLTNRLHNAAHDRLAATCAPPSRRAAPPTTSTSP